MNAYHTIYVPPDRSKHSWRLDTVRTALLLLKPARSVLENLYVREGRDRKEGLEKLEKAVSIRLHCRIPSGARAPLNKSIVDRSSRKGRTLVELMEMARGNPKFPRHEFDNKGVEEPCTLNVSTVWLEEFKDYKVINGIYKNTDLFLDSVLRGLSIEINGGGRTSGNAGDADDEQYGKASNDDESLQRAASNDEDPSTGSDKA